MAKQKTKYGSILPLLLITGLVALGLFIGLRSGIITWPLLNTPPATEPKNPNTIQTGPLPPFDLTITEGFLLGVFAEKLGKPRDLVFSPEGILLVSIPAQNRVVALPDRDQNGIADETVTVIDQLNNPHGIAFYNNQLFIAEETQVSRYLWDGHDLIATHEKTLFQLPPGGQHTTRSLTFNDQGQLFVSIGSTCNVCVESHEWYASIVISDVEGNAPQLFAKGLRNAVFMAVHPVTKQLWASEMGRDHLGDFAPPDEINIVQSNRNYGWPICWGDKSHDTVYDRNQYLRDPCANTEAPIYGIAAHSAPLGLTFIQSPQFPEIQQHNLLVAYHGSWNRKEPIGYQVSHLILNGNDVIEERNFITGFRQNNRVMGRPVDLIFDTQGSLYISDDHAGMIYKIIAAP